MEESMRLVASKKLAIHHHFASCAFPGAAPSHRARFRRSNHFRVTEAIYSQDKEKFAATLGGQKVRLPRISHGKRAPKYKSMPRFEPRISQNRRQGTDGSLSPKKPMSCKQSTGCLLDGYPHSLTKSWEASKDIFGRSRRRLSSIHSLEPAFRKLGTVLEKCKGLERSSSRLEQVKREQEIALSLESFMDATERTLEQIGAAPGELLEPMYAMRREADSAILLDAQQYVREDRGNLVEGTNKINRMIEREARHRKKVDKDG